MCSPLLLAAAWMPCSLLLLDGFMGMLRTASRESLGIMLVRISKCLGPRRNDSKARKYLAEQMEKHFFGGGADVALGYVPPAS